MPDLLALALRCGPHTVLYAGLILLPWCCPVVIARRQRGNAFSARADARKLAHSIVSKIRHPIYVFGAWRPRSTALQVGHSGCGLA